MRLQRDDCRPRPRRREPERGVLHRVLLAHLETFVARARESGPRRCDAWNAYPHADFEIVNPIADQLLATPREHGAQVLDLRPVFRAEAQPLYWSDLHIDLVGQQVAAR